jgi:hypothetical protein
MVDQFIERRGDENNWYTLLVGVKHNGEKHVYKEESMHFKADDGATFESAMRLAMGCVASEIQLGGGGYINIPGVERSDEEKLIDDMSYDELQQEIISNAFAALGWEFSTMSTMTWDQLIKREDFTQDRKSLGMYAFKTMAQAMLCFMDCCVAPFTQRSATPYEYRCFDLRQDDYGSTDLSNCAIIYADIHT